MSVVSDSLTLSQHCKALESADYITIDTEFIRERTYYPKVCLIQVSSSKTEAFAIDPLVEGIDMAPFLALLTRPDIVKIVHSGFQDLEIFYHEYGVIPVNLFDTQIAAMVCGFGPAASYASLVSSLVGVTLDKSSRFSDWSKRPLSAKQLQYALNDVIYLCDVYERLNEKLAEKKRLSWVVEEMEALTNKEQFAANADQIVRRMRPKANSERFLQTLRSLVVWREQKAIALDRPRGHILKDQVLLQLSASIPKTTEEILQTRFIGKLKKDEAQQILTCLNETRHLPNQKAKSKAPEPARREDIEDVLKLLLKQQSREHEVADCLIATKAELTQLAREDAPDIRPLKGWRYDIFGQYAQAVKRGELVFGISGSTLQLTPAPVILNEDPVNKKKV